VVLYSVKQAAILLSGSVALVYQLCAAGTLRHTRIGAPGKRGVIRIPQDAIAEYLKKREVGSDQPPRPPASKQRLSLDHLRVSRP
jgi:excisionase family DNA binding protein